jgi:hypothetical protein
VIVAALVITCALALALLAGTVGAIALLLRLLRHIDVAVERDEAGAREPAWWPEFERRFAEYAAEAPDR